jgi:hypothetical protein
MSGHRCLQETEKRFLRRLLRSVAPLRVERASSPLYKYLAINSSTEYFKTWQRNYRNRNQY